MFHEDRLFHEDRSYKKGPHPLPRLDPGSFVEIYPFEAISVPCPKARKASTRHIFNNSTR